MSSTASATIDRTGNGGHADRLVKILFGGVLDLAILPLLVPLFVILGISVLVTHLTR